MKNSWRILVVTIAMIFSVLANAQGCAQQPITEFFSCEPCFSGDTTTETCGPGGQPGWFCYEGHGLCCGIEFFTGNVYPDEFDCGPTGPGGGISFLKLQDFAPKRHVVFSACSLKGKVPDRSDFNGNNPLFQNSLVLWDWR
jgi:hypothetical protein